MRPPAMSGWAYTSPSTERAKRRRSLGVSGVPGATPARDDDPPNVVHAAPLAAARVGAVVTAGTGVASLVALGVVSGAWPPGPRHASSSGAACGAVAAEVACRRTRVMVVFAPAP